MNALASGRVAGEGLTWHHLEWTEFAGHTAAPGGQRQRCDNPKGSRLTLACRYVHCASVAKTSAIVPLVWASLLREYPRPSVNRVR